MSDKTFLRLKKLDALCAEDEIYQIWDRSYLEIEAAFQQYAAQQPDEIYRLLHGYAECRAMALQRKVLLACQHMVFVSENNEGTE